MTEGSQRAFLEQIGAELVSAAAQMPANARQVAPPPPPHWRGPGVLSRGWQISLRASVYLQGLRRLYTERQQLQDMLRVEVDGYKVELQVATMTGALPELQRRLRRTGGSMLLVDRIKLNFRQEHELSHDFNFGILEALPGATAARLIKRLLNLQVRHRPFPRNRGAVALQRISIQIGRYLADFGLDRDSRCVVGAAAAPPADAIDGFDHDPPRQPAPGHRAL
jgi:hypothetical protein